MRGIGTTMSLGERIGYYRVRRGMSQRILAELVGRSENWMQKVETGRIDLDRLSVIRALADVLDVTLGDLLGEPSLLQWSKDAAGQTVTAIRAALTDYRQLVPALLPESAAPDVQALEQEVDVLWATYQRSQYAALAKRLPYAISEAAQAVYTYDRDEEHQRAQRAYAFIHQVTTVLLTKLGEADLAWLAASRGIEAAHATKDPIVFGSLLRNAVHALSTDGAYTKALALARDGSTHLENDMLMNGRRRPGPKHLSIYGSLHLIGALAAAHADAGDKAAEHLEQAERASRLLGGDANHVWSAFGPTNVVIHQVSVAVELDDIQTALNLGPPLTTRGLPIERRVRHLIEVARAFERAHRPDDAIDCLLNAERLAAEQVHHHRLSRLLTATIVRRARPPRRAVGLAHRMGLLQTTPPNP